MLLDLLLSLGLLASTVSQFRPADSPVGPAELCLVLWLGLTTLRLGLFEGPRFSEALVVLLAFWGVMIAALCIGTISAYVIGDIHDPPWFWHDVVAYVITLALSGLCLADRRHLLRLERVLWLLMYLGTACLLVQVAAAFELIVIPDIDPWEWDRMRGFTENANQLALFCVVTALCALHLVEKAEGAARKCVAFAAFVTAIVVGRLTKSDAFLLAIVVALPFFLAVKLVRAAVRQGRVPTFGGVAAWLAIGGGVLVLAYGTALSLFNKLDAAKDVKFAVAASARSEIGETANVRFEIWTSALNRGIASGLLGLGPGPHLQIPPSIEAGRKESENEPNNTVHPKFGIVPNFEAHNTLLDLFVQGGIIADLDLLVLAGAVFMLALRGGWDGIAALLLGIGIYSLFHFTLRQPVIWFALVYAIAIITNRAGSASRSRVLGNPDQPWRGRAGMAWRGAVVAGPV